MPSLAAIHIYPLKSCAPVMLDAAVVESRGLAHDRRWMMVDADGKFLTGRQQPRLTLIRAQPDGHALQLDAPDMPTLRVDPPNPDGERLDTSVWGARVTPLLASAQAHAWISTFLGPPCRIVHMDAACVREVKAKFDGKYGEDGDEVSLADAFPPAVDIASRARPTQPQTCATRADAAFSPESGGCRHRSACRRRLEAHSHRQHRI